jgi:glutaredoxin-like protein
VIPLQEQNYLRQRFKAELTSRLRIDFFTQKPSTIYVPGRQDCLYCKEVQLLLEELASLSDRISLTVHDVEDAERLATTLGVDKVPAIVIRGQTNRPVRYFGLPTGTEFVGFVDTLVDAATGKVELRPETVRQLRKLKNDLKLQLFITTSCQYCPALVRIAAKLALQSNRIKLDIVEVAEFPALMQRYNLRVAPTIVIDDEVTLPGSMDEATFVETLLRVVGGRPLSSQPKVSLATPLIPQQQQQVQTQQLPGQVTSSGLILPR